MALSAKDKSSILAKLEAGESLRKASVGICDPATVIKHLKVDEDFAQQYARAREIGYSMLAEQILEISDDGSGDVIETEHGQKANAEFVARSRLRVDSRKWLLSKMLPKVYGEKQEVELTGKVTIVATPLDEAL